VSSRQRRELLESFLTAARTGDLAALEELLAKDVVSTSDGGGRVRASRVPVVGRDRVARYIAAFAARFWVGVEVGIVSVNGEDALLLRRGDDTIAVVAVNVSADGIHNVSWVMNPEKLSQV
jgi:RNA polymerase sigma-70 factor (ECF subfamily)